MVEPGWIGFSNGYQYRLTISSKDWQSSRIECQHYGGDLAAVGMRSWNSRR